MSLLGARHSSGAIIILIGKDAQLESRAPSQGFPALLEGGLAPHA